MSQVSVMWIRDGVLVDRMHINPVAFAVAYMAELRSYCYPQGLLEDLINFGFEKSGLSCADKMRLYNEQCANLLSEIDEAAHLYNQLCAIAAQACDYFDGSVELLRDLSAAGVRNYITSAVEQEVLDKWLTSPQAELIAPYLTEVLGRRENFSKGMDHFKYVSQTSQHTYYVADAVSEITAGKQFTSEFHIHPIGFAHEITAHRVLEAVSSVFAALRTLDPDSHLVKSPPSVKASELSLPSAQQISAALSQAGAEFTVSGPSLLTDLRAYFGRSVRL